MTASDSSTPPPNNSLRRTGRICLQGVVTVALVWWLVASGGLDVSLLPNLAGRWHWLVGALGCAVGVQILAALRWHWLLQIQGIELGAPRALRISWTGSFFNQLLFGTVGGDAYRAYQVDRAFPGRRAAAITTVLADRISGVALSLGLVLLALPWAWPVVASDAQLTLWVIVTITLLLVAFGLGACLVSRRLAAWMGHRFPRLRTTFAALAAHRGDPTRLVWILASGLLMQALVVVVNYLIAHALFPDGGIDFAVLCVTIPIALLAMALPVHPPGAIGTGEAIYHYMLALAGIPGGALVALTQRLLLVLQSLPGAWFLWRSGRQA